MKPFVLLLLFYLTIAACAAQRRIINGQDAIDGQIPYYAAITYGLLKNLCGASIVHKRWLLSAAHCFQRVGSSKNNIFKGQLYSIEKIINHEHYSYSRSAIIDDIALIRVKSDIQFSWKVQPIRLPKDSADNFEDLLATMSGLGYIKSASEGRHESKVLQFLWVRVVKLENCKIYYHQRNSIIDTHLCTLAEKGKRACYGDSGGPVVAKGLLIGIVSFGSPCYYSGRPDVHTRVSSYVDWIKNKTSLYSDVLF